MLKIVECLNMININNNKYIKFMIEALFLQVFR